MTVVASIPDALSELTALVQAGDIPAARKAGKKLINSADMRQLWLISRIAKLLEDRPNTAVDILRHWWKNAPTDVDRAIIEACAPKNGEKRRRPEPAADRAPRWNSRNTYQAPSTVRTKQSDEARTRRRNRQEQQDAAAFRRYQAERAGVAEGDQLKTRDDAAKDAQVYASGFDYDTAALYGTRGTRCVDCSISRGSAEVDAERIKAGHGDDGLCVECRESGRPGIPALPVGHTVADAVFARCSFIRTHAVDDVAARVALRVEWKHNTAARPLISDYVTANLPEEPAAPAAVELGTCHACPTQRTARDVRGLTTDDGYCADCREFAAELDAEQAAEATANAEQATEPAAA